MACGQAQHNDTNAAEPRAQLVMFIGHVSSTLWSHLRQPTWMRMAAKKQLLQLTYIQPSSGGSETAKKNKR